MSNVFDRLTARDQDVASADAVNGESDSVQSLDAQGSVDGPRTPFAVKKVVQELLKYGFVEESNGRESFRIAGANEEAIATVLEPLDLEMRLDNHRGIAFLIIAQGASENAEDDSEWTHPLIRRQRFTLEQSLVVALLRQAFMIHEQEAGVGCSPAKVAVDDLLPQYLVYFRDSGSDAKNESRLLSVLDQLKPHGIVSEVDQNQDVTIRPLIAHLANPESLAQLLTVLKAQARESQREERDI
jgi:hypothetical protein